MVATIVAVVVVVGGSVKIDSATKKSNFCIHSTHTPTPQVADNQGLMEV